MAKAKDGDTVYEVYDDDGNVTGETTKPKPGERFNVKRAATTVTAHTVTVDDSSGMSSKL